MGSMVKLAAAAAFLTAAAAAGALAQVSGKGPSQGPVIARCKDDIARFCSGKRHDGEVRTCLEGRKAEVTAACKTALETTGGGKGRKQ